MSKNMSKNVRKNIVIKRFGLDHVLAHNKILFNTNNHHFEENVNAPEDYDEVLKQGNTCRWIDKFHNHNEYYKLILDQEDLKWMIKALYTIGIITGKCSELYSDEVEITAKKYDDFFNSLPKGKRWFIRSERVSLKEGVHGVGPYNNMKEVIESLVSTTSGHSCFSERDTSCSLYFIPYIEMDDSKEFRIFVYQNQITAISDQHLYKVNGWLNTKSDEEIIKTIIKILTYFDKNIKEKMSYMGNYTMDLALIGDDEIPYFIEPNSFGKYYAAGSALFHWVYDHDALYGNNEFIEFRYVNEY
jgi:hypothetical protein